MRHDGFQHFVHQGLGLADRQAADAVAREIHLREGLRALNAQVAEKSALHDAKQRLAWRERALKAALGPAVRAVHGVLRRLMIARVGSTHIKGHDDIRA